ncbi:DUF711 family protein [Robertkochia solimangrovi]|uniref:DUF711 family protein n=1 Tax=Robertkochia solimangrovi TaxID=2213046 RepID=UPI00117F4CC6|nr:DUF711 family protein [Robertkochia solimangrovi]TRZ46331.1 DUF711 domain-containing protein [Robertkochia solimangrovi]
MNWQKDVKWRRSLEKVNDMRFRSLKLIWMVLLTLAITDAKAQELPGRDFRIRTITAGVNLNSLSDTLSIKHAIDFLKSSKQRYEENGYVVQTLRITTQDLYLLMSDSPDEQTLSDLIMIDNLLLKNEVALSVGQLVKGNRYKEDMADWVVKLVNHTENISFNVSIASEEYGIHYNTIRTAAAICKALADNSVDGEANFRFTASANCPANIPFFPAATHQGDNRFAIGLEYPNLITRVFDNSDWMNAEENLRTELNREFLPIERIALYLESDTWHYDGIDTSPAPGLDASIGKAIEALTGVPFGNTSTLSACAIITKVIKSLKVRSCGYSGLMLPVIEDPVLAKRAMEERYTVEELLLFSSVSGTGLDVVPLGGDISIETLENTYLDVATLSLKYFNKALSARLFPVPGKKPGDAVDFNNPHLTAATIMKLR